VGGIINCDFKWIEKDRRGFFEGDVMVLLVETILAVVPLHIGRGATALHSCGILGYSCFVFQL
jgi:hypothetical protein